MQSDPRVAALEDEFRLMKGELKQTLVDVRDFLLTVKLPAIAEEVVSELEEVEEDQSPTAGGDDGSAAPEGEEVPPPAGALALDLDDDIPEAPAPEAADLPPAPVSQQAGPDGVLFPEETMAEAPSPDAELAQDRRPLQRLPLRRVPPRWGEPSPLPEQQPEDEEPEGRGEERLPGRSKGRNMGDESEVSRPSPQVNLLANLTRWVSAAKKGLGSERLPDFLDVYATSGLLTPELKQVILHLADLVAQQPTHANAADVWSRLTLELHGILVENGTQLRPLSSFWNADEESESEEEEDKAKDKPKTLKLVLPGDDGAEREFCISLAPVSDEEEL